MISMAQNTNTYIVILEWYADKFWFYQTLLKNVIMLFSSLAGLYSQNIVSCYYIVLKLIIKFTHIDRILDLYLWLFPEMWAW